MKNIVFIDASPKINEPSTSKYLIDKAEKIFDQSEYNKIFINVRQSMAGDTTTTDFSAIAQADAVIIAFPLYIFCLPGILMRFLQDYQDFYVNNSENAKSPKYYAIVNCGFPESEINLEAVRVINSFCRHIKADFRFGIMIGGGGMLLEAHDAPVMRKTNEKLTDAYKTLLKDISSPIPKTIDHFYINVNLSRRMYLFIGDRSWISKAKKNRLKKKDLYRKPYQG